MPAGWLAADAGRESGGLRSRRGRLLGASVRSGSRCIAFAPDIQTDLRVGAGLKPAPTPGDHVRRRYLHGQPEVEAPVRCGAPPAKASASGWGAPGSGGRPAGCEGRWGWWGREATRAERSNGSGHATALPCQWRAWPRSLVRNICSVLKRLPMLTRVRRGGKVVWPFGWRRRPGWRDEIAVRRGTRQESKPWAGERGRAASEGGHSDEDDPPWERRPPAARRYTENSGIRRGPIAAGGRSPRGNRRRV